MTPQPHEVKRVPVGSERPARVHVIWHNRKFVGYTVRLDADQDKWAALSPYGALVGETNTHIEALSLLAPDAEIAPKKTSVYLDGATAAAVRRSGQPLAELIRKGLAASAPLSDDLSGREGAPADSGPSGGSSARPAVNS